LTSIILPTGGTVQYGYANFLDSFQNQNRWVQTKVKGGGTITFTPSTISNCSTSAGCQEQVKVTSPDNNDSIYTFTLDSGSTQAAGKSWVTGITAYQGLASASHPLKSSTTSYTYYSGRIGSTGPSYNTPTASTVTETLLDASVSSQVQVTLTQAGSLPSAIKKWDYYPSSGSAPAAPTLETDYTYSCGSFPYQVTVKDGSGNQISQATYGYDQTTPVATSGLTNHSSSVSGVRCNQTSAQQWINTSGGTISSTATFDDAGTMLSSTDPNGTTTYGHDTTDTFVTNSTPPIPSSGVALPLSAAVDFSSGLTTSITDPNGTQVLPMSFDQFGRPGEVDVTNAGATYAKTTYNYSPTQLSVHNYQNSAVYGDTETLYDSYARKSRVAVLNGQSGNPWYQVDYCYDTSAVFNSNQQPIKARALWPLKCVPGLEHRTPMMHWEDP
jgi:hypothetical protein